MSSTQTAMITVNAASLPSGTARSSSRNPSPKPIHAAPNTVELIAAVAGARVVATRKKRNARTSVDRNPPSIHSTPPSFAPTSAPIAPA